MATPRRRNGTAVAVELARDRRGSVAMIFALALPMLAVAAVAAMQLSMVVNARIKAQDVADSAALSGAQQLSVTPAGAAERAAEFARSLLAGDQRTARFIVSAARPSKSTIRVSIQVYMPSFFGDLLPRGGFRSEVVSEAEQQSEAPLCVLVDGGASQAIHLLNSSRMSGDCLAHSNGDVAVDGGAVLSATRTEAVGSASGAIRPAAFVAAPRAADPFSTLNVSPPATCSKSGQMTVVSGSLSPGQFFQDVKISDGAAVTLLSGEYYFCGSVTIGRNVTITGTDVVLSFAKNCAFNIDSTSTVALSGRRSGTLSGLVLIRPRDATDDFHVSVDRIPKITGAIYLPISKLVLDGSGQGAQASDWTVLAAVALDVTGSANVTINTNYAGSLTPVPIGVGDRSPASVHLRH